MTDFRLGHIKVVEVFHNEELNYWIGFVFPREMWEDFQEAPEGSGAELKAIDVFSALDEVTLLSRMKTSHSAIAIGHTDGEVKELPL